MQEVIELDPENITRLRRGTIAGVCTYLAPPQA
jgi:hypothetical protein